MQRSEKPSRMLYHFYQTDIVSSRFILVGKDICVSAVLSHLAVLYPFLSMLAVCVLWFWIYNISVSFVCSLCLFVLFCFFPFNKPQCWKPNFWVSFQDHKKKKHFQSRWEKCINWVQIFSVAERKQKGNCKMVVIFSSVSHWKHWSQKT